ncbi:hypothetical protein C1H46_005506 [Malus baccata]|uniref:Uncharacterized protein n=1 Tax=Malus baccata TaxID=106549 RepID=A0A540NCY1_MALBA|nr:hypothetical protein C1H46_005506 [Malus baccata]
MMQNKRKKVKVRMKMKMKRRRNQRTTTLVMMIITRFVKEIVVGLGDGSRHVWENKMFLMKLWSCSTLILMMMKMNTIWKMTVTTNLFNSEKVLHTTCSSHFSWIK